MNHCCLQSYCSKQIQHALEHKLHSTLQGELHRVHVLSCSKTGILTGSFTAAIAVACCDSIIVRHTGHAPAWHICTGTCGARGSLPQQTLYLTVLTARVQQARQLCSGSTCHKKLILDVYRLCKSIVCVGWPASTLSAKQLVLPWCAQATETQVRAVSQLLY